jgi:glycosyltransferase involved in cell wall biosynthesis
MQFQERSKPLADPLPRRLAEAGRRPIGEAALAVRHPPIGEIALPSLPAKPLVSIIVPSFNQGRFIRETLDSILQQDYRPIQVIIIDGASGDETVAILKSYGDLPELEWVSEPDRGVVEAVNKGFERARGEILAIQSSDDYYLPGVVKRMVSELTLAPTVGLVYADFETCDATGKKLFQSQLSDFSLAKFLSKQTWIPQPSTFFRRELIEACGGWDERYFIADTELWLRLVFRTRARKVQTSIARRRLHEAQRNEQHQKISESYERMIRESPDLKSAPAYLRRAARAGALMAGVKYSANNAWIERFWRTWAAIAIYPALWAELRMSPLIKPPLRQLLAPAKALLRRASGKP